MGRVYPWVGSIHGSGLSMGRVYPWVGSIHGSGRVGSQNSPFWMGRVWFGSVSKMSNKYTIYMQETDIRRLRLIMIRICNVAIYFNSKLLSWQKAVACETMMLASELPSHLVDKLKDSAADGKTKSPA